MATTIATTRVATSNDPSNICQGLALFPAVGQAKAGIAVNNTTGSIFKTSPEVWPMRLNASAGYQVFMGLCGPGYGVGLDAAVQVDGTHATFTASNDVLAAGMFAGFTVGLNFNIVLDVWKPHFPCTRVFGIPVCSPIPTGGEWVRAASVGPSVKFDLINIILTLVRMMLDEAGKKDTLLQKVNNITPALLGTWGMFDLQKNSFSKNNGTMTAKPTFNIPVDISSFIPALKAINTTLKALMCGFQTGPQIGLQIPVSVSVDKITLDTTEVAITSYSGGKGSGTASASLPTNPQKMTLSFKHSPGFDFTLGWFANLSLCKLFSIGGNVSFPVLNLLGIKVVIGTYHNDLSNTVGHTSVAKNACTECGVEFAQSLEVIFEEPEWLAA